MKPVEMRELWVVIDGDAVVGPFPEEEAALAYIEEAFEPDGVTREVRKVIDP